MATSVLDYIFREVAVSYLGRNDLSHAQPEDILPDSLGNGEKEGELPHDPARTIAAIQKVASTGFVRSSNLLVITGGGKGNGAAPAETANGLQSASGKSAVAAVTVSETVVSEVDEALERVREARAKGYEGDACGECGNFTLVRNGTCMKCVTCGATSGCS